MQLSSLRRWLVGAALLCGFVSAQAETYIYVTNTTAQPLTVSTVQYGDKALSKGHEWGTYDPVIPPYATRKVAWMNRDQGITNGKNFYFDTTVIGAKGGAQVLKQKLRGKLIGSSIWHGAKANAFETPWYSDRSIHTNTVVPSEQLSFKAEFTGGYDDIYYIVHDANVKETPTNDPNTLKVLAYNTWGIFVAKNICDRYAAMPEATTGFDAIVLSEAFDGGCREQLLNDLRAEYPYQTRLVDEPGNIMNGGVIAVSRWPIAAQDVYVYPDCTGDNCFSNKGFIYFEIIKQGKSYHVLGTHTNAYNGADDRRVRLSQLGQMGRYAAAHGVPASEPVVYAGDLNVDRYATPDDYVQMLGLLHAAEPRYLGYGYTYDSTVNALGGGGREYLDYVFADGQHKVPHGNDNTVRIYRSLNSSLWMDHDLSDHFAVSGVLRY